MFPKLSLTLETLRILSIKALGPIPEGAILCTHEMSYTLIDFLDTTVKFGQDRGLNTTLYNKPTGTQLYLEHSSAHPNSILTKGPYGQYLRLRRICTLHTDFELNAKKLTGYYFKRGYQFPSEKTLSQSKEI